MLSYLQILFQTINLHFAGMSFSPSYWQAGGIIFLVFLLVVMIAQLRRHYLNWSFKGALFGLFWGFVLALVVEGFFMINGKTALTQILGWKNAPKPISNVLDLGRSKIVKVLGDQTQTQNTAATLVNLFQNLSLKEAAKARVIICKP